ncbi:MAG: hypothetical protein M9916_09560 [Crocinitomicaceae bacterium]|nr:hypothetical protein [Crocinitomicaceae bacterium]
MFGFFKRKKTAPVATKAVATTLMPIDYDAKIIIAWAKAIEGDEKFTLWLKENYFELFMATYAIYLKEEARDWLMKNGYAHLMAFINAAEGLENAQKWLLAHKFDLLFHMAMAIEGEQEHWQWLNQNSSQDIFILTKSIKEVKDKIEENHNDIHTFRKDF